MSFKEYLSTIIELTNKNFTTGDISIKTPDGFEIKVNGVFKNKNNKRKFIEPTTVVTSLRKPTKEELMEVKKFEVENLDKTLEYVPDVDFLTSSYCSTADSIGSDGGENEVALSAGEITPTRAVIITGETAPKTSIKKAKTSRGRGRKLNLKQITSTPEYENAVGAIIAKEPTESEVKRTRKTTCFFGEAADGENLDFTMMNMRTAVDYFNYACGLTGSISETELNTCTKMTADPATVIKRRDELTALFAKYCVRVDDSKHVPVKGEKGSFYSGVNPLPVDTVMGWYLGKIEYKRPLDDSPYIMKVDNVYIVGDGKDWSNKMNDCRILSSKRRTISKKEANVGVFKHLENSNPLLVTLKIIEPGVELLIDYGSEYFK